MIVLAGKGFPAKQPQNRPGGHKAGDGSRSRGHSLSLPRQRGKWEAGHQRDHRQPGEAGRPTEENFEGRRSPLMSYGDKESSPRDFKP